MHNHILICGDVGVGKSTLISKLLENTSKHITGFFTKAREEGSDGKVVYMYPAGNPAYSECHGKCLGNPEEVRTDIFDTYGVELLSDISSDDIILMDEIGFMERNAKLFTERILELLDGTTTIVAAVKTGHNDVEFLNRVRNHKNADIYYIDENNRDELYGLLKDDSRLK